MATVTTQAALRTAIQSGTDPEILVANDITVTSFVTVNRAVTVRSVPGNPTAALYWALPTGTGNQYLFQVNASGSLTIDALTMDGQGRDCGLVKLNGGTYTMNDGVTMTGIQSNTANSAVTIGDLASAAGGTFVMNGGRITGVDAGPHTVVFCASGTVILRGDAAIENNPSTGLTATENFIDFRRSTVRITENARISNNRSGQTGAGLMLYMTDAVIGESDSDAPLVSANQSPYHAGGIFIAQNSVLSIGGRAEISGNSAPLTSGGIAVQSGSTLRIGGNAKVKDNRCGGSGGGINITSNSIMVLEGNAEISGNTAGDETIAGAAGSGVAGGILLQTGAFLEVKGNAAIYGNSAENGGGIYLAAPPDPSRYGAPAAVIGTEESSPSVYENTAAGLGGGIFIEPQCNVTLTGRASVHDNRAGSGKGVYNDGIFSVAESPRILDGLFFECSPDPLAAEELLQCDKAPVIEKALTTQAEIHVEPSGHVAVPNVPLVLAQGGGGATPLTGTDRAAWRIPPAFLPGYAVMLTPGLDQVIIDAVTYRILYRALFGSANPNPPSYKINGLPIRLTAPSARIGYSFAGWRDAAGNFVTEIPVGSTGALALTAVWQAQVYRIAYSGLHGTANPNPASYSAETLPILLAAPSERTGYSFTGWRDTAGNFVTEIPVGSTGALALTAVWQAQVYRIAYNDLFGAANPNPASYDVETLPILLAAPSERIGYTFTGWRDAAGNFVTEIPVGSTGALALTAVWQVLFLSFDGNAPCVCNLPHNIPAENGIVQIPRVIPCRPCHHFLCWNALNDGSGIAYSPGNELDVSGKNITLYAQWAYVGCCRCPY